MLALLTLGTLRVFAEPTAGAAKLSFESVEWLDYRVFGGDRSDLPRVLLIGDSISGHYFDPVVKGLQGKAYVTRLGTSKAVNLPAYFDEIRLALSQYHYDVIHFNNGLHGWGYTEDEYRQGLTQLIQLLKTLSPKSKLVWASSTQLRKGPPAYEEFAPNNERVIARNKIAAELMSQEKIPVDDLYTLMEPHHDLLKDGTHYNAEGAALLANQVLPCILKALE